MTCRSRRLVLVLTALGLGALARLVARRRAELASVAPELRSPIVLLPVHVTGPRVLALARQGIARPVPVPATVAIRSERVPADAASGPHGASDGVRVVLYEGGDRTRPRPAVVWIHGGGTIMGIPEQSHDAVARTAEAVGALVVSVDYRLAPEHPFPAALEDCWAALVWLADHADDLGVDRGRIAIGGDSAGGLLAASLAQLARDRGGPAIAFQALVYPMLDDRTVLRGEPDRTTRVWTHRSNAYAWTAYLGHAPSADPERPYAAPARTEDLAGLPPAWIGVGDLDLFLEEDLEYAARLQAAGVACEVHVEPGMYHGADALFPSRPSMRAFRARADGALRAAIGEVAP
ncbi:MAG TPA: alpha/beta hydrolase [Aquihabitans sp.]|nr:alpha/beta hydrolase [Aquihabitans sp.]